PCAPAPRAARAVTRRERLTLIATILASTVVFLDATVVNVALPAMERNLDMGLAGQQWVVEAYLLALVSLMLVGGSLGDHFGRRRVPGRGPLLEMGVLDQPAVDRRHPAPDPALRCREPRSACGRGLRHSGGGPLGPGVGRPRVRVDRAAEPWLERPARLRPAD